MNNKIHHATGNTNAQKGDEPASTFLHIRCTKSAKAFWIREAKKKGINLTDYTIGFLPKDPNKE